MKLPEIFLDVTVESRFLCPTVGFEGLADVTLHIGRHRTRTVVVLVIALAGIDIYEVVLDGALYSSRHIVIHGRKANRHANWLILTEQRTTLTLHLWVAEVNTEDIQAILGFITGE